MINQGIDVPNNTIAVFAFDGYDINQLNEHVEPLVGKKKREWFSKHFYNCLPLVIGNQYGFIIKAGFDISFIWDGNDNPEGIFFWSEIPDEKIDKLYPRLESVFGHGIVTVRIPLIFRTPPQVNIMTINPPNFILPNITVLTGVIETDNLRRNFTFNLKIQTPNKPVHIEKGTPLSGFIPIPRYYADSYKLELAENIFAPEILEEEYQTQTDFGKYRKEVEPNLRDGIGRFYRKGIDVYGNKFPDHQI